MCLACQEAVPCPKKDRMNARDGAILYDERAGAGCRQPTKAVTFVRKAQSLNHAS